MNLPTHIHLENGDIYFTYDALGNKWYKFVSDEQHDGKKGTAYLFGYQYEFDYIGEVMYDWKLMFFPTAEGYVSAVYPEGITGGDPPKFAYVTNIRDHLGNLRMSITRDNNDKVILQERNYYPFGLLHQGYNEEKHEIKYTEAEEDKIFTPQVVAGHYKYWYNGKEWQEDLGLDVYDYGARQYEPAVGRWFVVDPLGEKYYSITPYNYTGNNPVLYIDFEGKFRIKPEQAKKYQRLTHYLKYEIQNILNNKKIVNALKKWGHFTDAQLKEIFTFGKGPLILIEDMEDAIGKFTPESNSNVLHLNKKYVERLEKAKGLEREALLFLLGVTILHETTHYGDDKNNGNQSKVEEGYEFEKDAYGRIVNLSDAFELIKKYIEKRKSRSNNRGNDNRDKEKKKERNTENTKPNNNDEEND